MPIEDDLLFSEGLSVLEVLARRLSRQLGQRIPVEDLIAIGRAALVEIVRAYDPSRSGFTAYVKTRLRWAILDGVRRETCWRTEIGHAVALGASDRYAEGERAGGGEVMARSACESELGRLLAGHAAAMALGMVAVRHDVSGSFADGGDSPEEVTARAELADAVRRAVHALPERERVLIERHYFGGERFDEIARDLGISKSRASRLHAQGIDALGEALRASAG